MHISHYKRLIFLLYPYMYFTPYFFSGNQKSFTHQPHLFPHFCIVLIYYWICSPPEYSWKTARLTLSNNQSDVTYLQCSVSTFKIISTCTKDTDVTCLQVSDWLLFNANSAIFQLSCTSWHIHVYLQCSVSTFKIISTCIMDTDVASLQCSIQICTMNTDAS